MKLIWVSGIVFLCLSIIGGIVHYAIQCYKKDNYSECENTTPKFSKVAIVLSIISVIAIVVGNAIVIIPTGYTGVRSTFGQIDNRTLQNGLNFRIPGVQTVEKVNNKQQDITFTDQIWSETAERTALYYQGVTVTYRVNPEKSAWIFSNISSYEDSLISYSMVQSAIKIASKTLSSVNATARDIIEPLTQELLQKSANEKYGSDTITISKVTVAKADFEESYNEAIAEKQNAQLEYETMQIENKKKIEEAEAEATVKTTQAKAEAEAKVIKAQGEADANKLLEESITEMILRQEYIDKWNGVLPKVQLSENSGVMIDTSSVIEDTAQ